MARPRKPGSGGPRVGQAGKAYPNRTDLTRSSQPIKAAAGQPYGARGEQETMQRAQPLPTQAGMAAPPAAPTGAPSVLPGQLGPLDGQTDRPNEPLTAGLASGPGGGPEMLAPPDPLLKGAAVLNALGDTADPWTRQLRERVNATLNNQGAA